MHDPSTLLFDVPVIRLVIWHDDPDGCDAGSVCGNPPNSTFRGILWAGRHFRHLRFRWRPYLRVKRWLTEHCDECGRRFFWKDSRHGYMGSDEVFHGACMSLQRVRNDLDDLTAYVTCTADSNAEWRARYRLDRLMGLSTDPQDQG